MALKFFTIPTRTPEFEEGDLNKFLGTHRILAVAKRFVDDGANSFWTVCVDYMAGARPLPPPAAVAGKKGRIDYREKLKPADFQIYAKLRDLQ